MVKNNNRATLKLRRLSACPSNLPAEALGIKTALAYGISCHFKWT